MIRFGVIFVSVVLLFAFPSLSSAKQQYANCRICHKYLDTKKVVHRPVQVSCLSCHTEPHRKEQKHSKGLFEEDAKLCFGCHTKADFKGNDIHQPIASGGCLFCHEVHSADNEKLLKAAKPDLCFGCHGESEFKGTVVHPPLAKGGCMNCHSPHKSDFPALLSEKNEKFCSRCHDIDRYASGRYVHSPAKSGSRMGSCVKCHNPHTSQNAKLLERPVPELCYDCHSKEKFTAQSVHEPVKNGCGSCHFSHQAENQGLLKAPAPGLCFQCHPDAEFRRKVKHVVAAQGRCLLCHNSHSSNNPQQLVLPVNELCARCHKGMHESRGALMHRVAGKRDPKRKGRELTCTSCHNPHSSESPGLYRYKADSEPDLCRYCHNK